MSLFFLHHPTEGDLALFAGGEAGLLSRWRIERHLDRCGGCREVVADFFHLQADLADLAEVPQLDWVALARRIKNAAGQIETSSPKLSDPLPKAPGGRFGQPVWGLSFAVAVLLCGFVLHQQLLQERVETAALTDDPRQTMQDSPSAAQDDGATPGAPIDGGGTSARAVADLADRREKAGQTFQPRAGLETTGEIHGGDGLRSAAVATSPDSRAEMDWSPAAAGDAEFLLIPAGWRAEDAEIGVAADGSMSIRTLDSATGAVTITHVYLP